MRNFPAPAAAGRWQRHAHRRATPLPRRTRLATSSGLAAFLALAAVPAGAQAPDRVEIVDIAYAPTMLTIMAGESVTWVQTGAAPHTVTADDGLFDSSPDCTLQTVEDGTCMTQGDTFVVSFDEPGTYPYYCRLHGGPGGSGQSGVIEVVAASESPDTTATPDTTGSGTDAPAVEDAATDAEPSAATPTEPTSLPSTGAPAWPLVVLAGALLASGYLARRAADRG